MAEARLFVAILPPPLVRAEVAALAAPIAGLRWTPEENLHLTLRFIGDCAAEKHEKIATALGRVRVEPFILPVGGVGLFPTRGPAKVIWAGVGGGHPRLHQLRKQVDEALLTVDSGLAMPGFHAHFTVARPGPGIESKQLARFLEQHAQFEAPPFRVDQFHLMASELSPGRPPAYRSVQVFPLTR